MLSRSASTFHYMLKESRGRFGFPTTDAEAESRIVAKMETGEIPSWERSSVERTLAGTAKCRAEIAALDEEIEAFEEVYEGWSRFFLVQANGGHIHSWMGCPTCNKMGKATHFGWLPSLSGLTEAEAVAEHGTILCSVCFPSAPVEWTVGKTKPAGCAGTGAYVEYIRETVIDRRTGQPREAIRNRGWAKCPVCSETISRTSSGVLRKHKPKGA